MVKEDEMDRTHMRDDKEPTQNFTGKTSREETTCQT
jgi:hypothetical protein